MNQSQVIDIVKPQPRTELELHNHWRNHITSLLLSGSLSAKKIQVKYIGSVCNSWASQKDCTNSECSWFNHAMAGGMFGGDYPTGFNENQAGI